MNELCQLLSSPQLASAGGPPASAQFAKPGIEFVEAVRKSDGDKVDRTAAVARPVGLLNSRDDDGDTALIVAIARRDDEWTGFLLNKGADPDLPARNGDTPLIAAAARSAFDEAVGWLLRRGAKVDATNRMGETALIVAVQQRQLPIVKLLLEGRRRSRQGPIVRLAIRRATMPGATIRVRAKS